MKSQQLYMKCNHRKKVHIRQNNSRIGASPFPVLKNGVLMIKIPYKNKMKTLQLQKRREAETKKSLKKNHPRENVYLISFNFR